MPNPSLEPPASSKATNQDLKDMVVICTFKIKKKAKIRKIGVSKTNQNIQIKIMIPNPSQEHPASSKAPNQDLKDMDVLCTFKIKIEGQYSEQWCIKDYWPYINQDPDAKPQQANIWIMGAPKASDHIQIKNKIPKLSQEPPVSSKAPNQDLKDTDVLCTFKIIVNSQNSNNRCIKDQ